MRSLLHPLRIRLAIAGFGAVYTPVVLLLSAGLVTQRFEETLDISSDLTVVETSTGTEWPVILITAAALAPIAVALAWWWSGRAIRPIERAMEIQQQLMEDASHELRTPLSVLTTNAEVLLDHPEPTIEVFREGLERSRRAAEGMSETIDALLVDARGRARTIDRRPTDLHRLAGEVIERLGPLAEESRVVVRAPKTAAVRAPVDAETVQRAMANLVTNAIQHSPAGGLVTVEITTDEDLITFTVADQGPGIGAEDREHIFDRYWQAERSDDGSSPSSTSSPDGGAGIGLAIVRQVARAHGGTATVTGPDDGTSGSVYRMTLPRR